MSLPPGGYRPPQWPQARECTWPLGGCGELILDFRTAGKGKKQVLDLAPGSGIIVGSLITTLDTDDGLVVGFQHPDVELRTAVVPTWIDHHATCAKWAEYLAAKKEAGRR
jgi:hypothetical protein